MTKTFEWVPTIDGSSGDATLRVRKAEFGDGYTQRVADGINNRSSTFSLRFVGDAALIAAIIAFLDEHGGATSFYWTPPLRQRGAYVCEKYSEPAKLGRLYSITAQFSETFSI